MNRIPTTTPPAETSDTAALRDESWLALLAENIRLWGRELGFQQVGITDTDLSAHKPHLMRWLEQGFHGCMGYMADHGEKRAHPEAIIPGTIRVISLRMDYLPANPKAWETLRDGEKAYISRYALGRDYHRVIRKRVQLLADRIQEAVGTFGYRPFVDSGPVLEKALAEKAGLGWIGKHTLVINRSAGSFFFLAELLTDLPLPIDTPASAHCGSCTACLDICPTKAFVGPYQLDARKCISYLTIESKDAIPVELRPLIGNRVFGCDDCQLVCPWNRYARSASEPGFTPRHKLDEAGLVELFLWSEDDYLRHTEGSPLRRIGYPGWLRNLATGLGNAPTTTAIITALESRRNDDSPLVREHVEWALMQHGQNIAD